MRLAQVTQKRDARTAAVSPACPRPAPAALESLPKFAERLLQRNSARKPGAAATVQHIIDCRVAQPSRTGSFAPWLPIELHLQLRFRHGPAERRDRPAAIAARSEGPPPKEDI